jgi:CRISPR-associated protein Cas2
MPFTVITLRNVPNSLRGDLTRWMQEIATGVYVGNYNSKVREYLWKRISETVEEGEATISYSCRNEVGYSFFTCNTKRQIVDFDGIPLVLLPWSEFPEKTDTIKKTANNINVDKQASSQTSSHETKYLNDSISPNSGTSDRQNDLVFLDIETTGLNADEDQIIEIGARRVFGSEPKVVDFHRLIRIDRQIPDIVRNLTKITDEMLNSGSELETVIKDFQKFIQDAVLVGYNISFDIKFLNKAFEKFSLGTIHNKTKDLMFEAKRRKVFQLNYKFGTTLKTYGIDQQVLHRALQDAKLVQLLYYQMFHVDSESQSSLKI